MRGWIASWFDRPVSYDTLWGAAVTWLTRQVGGHAGRPELHRDVWIADEDFEMAAGVVPAGSVGAIRFQIGTIVNVAPFWSLNMSTSGTKPLSHNGFDLNSATVAFTG